MSTAGRCPKTPPIVYDLMHYTNAGAARLADIIAAPGGPFLAGKFPQYYQSGASAIPAAAVD